ncbi:MAG: glycosyltransferase family 2 protein [Flavobacteriales bacterium]|nr:glycosyltransferase family 2 protein [Flavobacteriales bacterium]
MKVSVIIPCFNVEKYILECVESVENQTFKDCEIICVDDGSDDETLTILKQLQVISSVPFKIYTQKNLGAPSARNQGLRLAQGEYIQFLDADDMIKPKKIEVQINLAENNDCPELIVGSYQRKNLDSELIKVASYASAEDYNVWLQLMKTDLGITSSNLFLSRPFLEGLKWSENLKSSQEYDLMFRLLKGGARVAYDESQNTIIRERSSGSISQINVAEKWGRYVELRGDILNYCKESKESVSEDLLQSMFVAIRMLYPYDPDGAVRYFNEHIPKNFVPKISASITRGYVQSYRLLGFEQTEKLKEFIRPNKAG